MYQLRHVARQDGVQFVRVQLAHGMPHESEWGYGFVDQYFVDVDIVRIVGGEIVSRSAIRHVKPVRAQAEDLYLKAVANIPTEGYSHMDAQTEMRVFPYILAGGRITGRVRS